MGVATSDLFDFVRVHPPSFDLYTCTKICKKSKLFGMHIVPVVAGPAVVPMALHVSRLSHHPLSSLV